MNAGMLSVYTKVCKRKKAVQYVTMCNMNRSAWQRHDLIKQSLRVKRDKKRVKMHNRWLAFSRFWGYALQ